MKHFTSLFLGLSLLTAAGAYAAPADEIISEEPAGTVKWYSGMSMAYTPSIWGYVDYKLTDGVARKLVFAEDGSVYFRDPIAMFPTGTYVKGTVEYDQIVLPVPQTIMVKEKNGEEQVWTIGLLRSERIYDEEFESWKTVWNVTDQESLTFDILPDGSIVQNETDGDLRLTAFCDGAEMVYGDTDILLTPVDPTQAAARFPETGEIEDWTISYKVGARRVGQPVEVVREGNDVFMRGFWASQPAAVLKGTMENGQLIIPSRQYLGWMTKSDIQYFQYLMTYTPGSEGILTKYMLSDQPLRFFVNEETGSFTLATGDLQGLMVKNGSNVGYEVSSTQYDCLIDQPGFQIREGAYLDPMAPEYINNIMTAYAGVTVPFVSVEFCILPFDLNGNALNQNDLKYCAYFDGEKVLFDAAEFANYDKVTEPTYEMPLDFKNNWGIMYESGNIFQRRLQLKGADPESVGVQVIFYDPETEARKVSKIATYYPETKEVKYLDDPAVAVEEIAAEGEVKEVLYFDLMGKRVSKDYKGVCVKAVVYENGAVRNFKVMR